MLDWEDKHTVRFFTIPNRERDAVKRSDLPRAYI
jgi:hypothetical protein